MFLFIIFDQKKKKIKNDLDLLLHYSRLTLNLNVFIISNNICDVRVLNRIFVQSL